MNYDAHIQFTHQIAEHEYLYAVQAKNYLMAIQWSLLWYNTHRIGLLNADNYINPWKGR